MTMTTEQTKHYEQGYKDGLQDGHNNQVDYTIRVQQELRHHFAPRLPDRDVTKESATNFLRHLAMAQAAATTECDLHHLGDDEVLRIVFDLHRVIEFLKSV